LSQLAEIGFWGVEKGSGVERLWLIKATVAGIA
jgi:hypothetical protein